MTALTLPLRHWRSYGIEPLSTAQEVMQQPMRDFPSWPSGSNATGAEDRADGRLADERPPPHAPGMFVVTEADVAAIRAVYQQRGEFAAAIELRRRFPGITDNAQARECARTIAGWKPLRPVKRMPEPSRLRRVR
jgi:hypothetical protein